MRVLGLLWKLDDEKPAPVKAFAAVVRKAVLQAGLRPNRTPAAP